MKNYNQYMALLCLLPPLNLKSLFKKSGFRLIEKG